MSEYQYYEFRAVDKPLTEKDMQTLRNLSTRARITPTSFVNEYNWGDLKGDPLKLVERYFDAFLYVANWGTHWFMLKVPRHLIDVDLRDLNKMTGKENAFNERMKTICENHRRKSTFLNRLNIKGLIG